MPMWDAEIQKIISAVSEKYSMAPKDIKKKTNRQEVVFPRHVAMYLVRRLTMASLPQIGRSFGGKHHTTALHGIEKINNLRHTGELVGKQLDELERVLGLEVRREQVLGRN